MSAFQILRVLRAGVFALACGLCASSASAQRSRPAPPPPPPRANPVVPAPARQPVVRPMISAPRSPQVVQPSQRPLGVPRPSVPKPAAPSTARTSPPISVSRPAPQAPPRQGSMGTSAGSVRSPAIRPTPRPNSPKASGLPAASHPRTTVRAPRRESKPAAPSIGATAPRSVTAGGRGPGSSPASGARRSGGTTGPRPSSIGVNRPGGKTSANPKSAPSNASVRKPVAFIGRGQAWVEAQAAKARGLGVSAITYGGVGKTAPEKKRLEASIAKFRQYRMKVETAKAMRSGLTRDAAVSRAKLLVAGRPNAKKPVIGQAEKYRNAIYAADNKRWMIDQIRKAADGRSAPIRDVKHDPGNKKVAAEERKAAEAGRLSSSQFTQLERKLIKWAATPTSTARFAQRPWSSQHVVVVRGHERDDGTRVSRHRRRLPD